MQRENIILFVLLDPTCMPSLMHYAIQHQTHAARIQNVFCPAWFHLYALLMHYTLQLQTHAAWKHISFRLAWSHLYALLNSSSPTVPSAFGVSLSTSQASDSLSDSGWRASSDRHSDSKDCKQNWSHCLGTLTCFCLARRHVWQASSDP